MDAIDTLNEDLSLTFKFGGYWREISNKNRRIYEGGKQKTLKLKKDMINFDVLTKETEVICPWLKGHCFELYYHVNGTSPKVYKLITADEEVLQMIEQSSRQGRTEVVVTTQDNREEGICSQGIELMDVGVILESYQSNEQYTYKDLYVGSCFPDAKTFKQALRSSAIINNFGVKIISCNKSRVIAICSYRGCPWRIRVFAVPKARSVNNYALDITIFCFGGYYFFN